MDLREIALPPRRESHLLRALATIQVRHNAAGTIGGQGGGAIGNIRSGRSDTSAPPKPELLICGADARAARGA
eukprot:5029438-Alexandrium_andersonii.AAC.1